jgi:CHAT domain-containing protein
LSRRYPNAASFSENSSKRAVLAALPPGGVVHFACHALAQTGAPLRTGIILPNGETLTVRDIFDNTIPPLRLAVLSACETGIPDPPIPGEVVSLSAALLASGAEGVISTLWPVEDLSTTLLIGNFYWDWRVNGAPTAVALARGQRWQASRLMTKSARSLGFSVKPGC